MSRKIVLFLLIAPLFLSGCSVVKSPTFTTWDADSQLYWLSQQLRIGDIIITGKYWHDPLSWFGHSAVMVSRYKVGEYPRITVGYEEERVIPWLKGKTEFIILRYDYFDESFKRAFLQNVAKAKHKNYRFVRKTNDNAFYCSQYIWYLYWKTAQDLGYDLDIDSDGGPFVTPYDLLNSDYFKRVIE